MLEGKRWDNGGQGGRGKWFGVRLLIVGLGSGSARELLLLVGFYCLPPRSGGQADIDSKAGPIL